MAGWKGKAIPLILLGVSLAAVFHIFLLEQRLVSSDAAATATLLLTEDMVGPHARGTIDMDYSNFLRNASQSLHVQGPEELQLWCQLDPENTVERIFWHFPHTSQALLPCWSWFQTIMRDQERARNHNMETTMARTTTTIAPTIQCGFYMKNWSDKDSRRATDPEWWIAQLIKHMGCSVTTSEPTLTRSIRTKNCTENCKEHGVTEDLEGRNSTLVYRMPKEAFDSRQFFERPEDAAALRTTVFQSLNVTDTPRTAGTPARIAFVDRRRRRRKRRILNLDNITAAVRAAFPSATVETAYMEDMQPFEQFVFWGQHDIIIAGHGAAMMNAIFLPPGNTSAVIEIYPPHYAPPIFVLLLQSAGIRAYPYFNGVSNWLEDHQEHSRTLAERDLYRNVDLKPPVDDILDLVRRAMSEAGFV